MFQRVPLLSLLCLSGCSLFFAREGKQTECDPREPQCEGNISLVCDTGRLFRIDCGENTCDPSSGSCSVCGDGLVQSATNEDCDDGNTNSGDGCQDDCQLPSCGDGVIDLADDEQCDDGNSTNGDGCQENCRLPGCGDGFLDPADGEQCDDTNNIDGDGCQGDCQLPSCGDGITDNISLEECDDGNEVNDDGCDADCTFPEVAQLSSSFTHNCVTLDSGVVRCWGANVTGELGYGNVLDIGDNEPPAVAGDVNVGGGVEQVSVGLLRSCALLTSGSVRCWGDNVSGLLGYELFGNIGDNESPASAGDINLGGSAIQVSSGFFHSCALLDTGDVRCWGSAFRGLGYGNIENIGDDESPADVGDINFGGVATQIATGAEYTCALLNTGNVRCWGAGSGGRLGYGNTQDIGDDELPVLSGDVNVGGVVTQIVAGGFHTCALLNTGNVRCWGFGDSGRLGYGNINNIGDDEHPAIAGDVNIGGVVTQLTAGFHTCALLDAGNVRCWGLNSVGQLGYGNTDNIGDDEFPESAGDVEVGGVVSQIVAGLQHTCAILDTGRVRCWGDGADGRLGYGALNTIGDDELPESTGEVPIFLYASICGDGLKEGIEFCDDDNTNDGDGCSNNCTVEAGFVCSQNDCRQIICGDGLFDFPEQCDDGNTIEDDGCSSSCLIEGQAFDCDVDQTLLQFSSLNPSLEIPDNDPFGLVSAIGVGENLIVEEIFLRVDSLQHEFVQDLQISLVSPLGESVLLFDRRLGGPFIGAELDDDCLTTGGSIVDAPVYTGCFAPEESLALFEGGSTNGGWFLQVVDLSPSFTGTLDSWTLGFCVR
jgi:cysteine-rich repeat protein